MNNSQYLLNKLAEECNEVAQMALKTAQFGFDEKMPGQPYTNSERLEQELNDMCGILTMLDYECGFNWCMDSTAIENKMEKVKKYRKYSQELGFVK